MNPQDNKPQAKYFFLQIGIIVALYTSAVSFLTFGFSVINYIFPDRLAYDFSYSYSSGMRFAISTLIVAFPVLVYLSRLMYKNLKENITLREGALRRWIAYFTLFVAGLVIAGDLITLINTFLSGEISTRFFCKVLLVLVVAAGVFWYTVRDLKGIYFDKPGNLKLFTIISSIVVLASLVGGLFIVGLPQDQRSLRDDQTRESNLGSIQWQVVDHYQRTGKLPASLDQTVDPLYPDSNNYFKDPETGIPYEYRTVASTTPVFEMCADFALPSPEVKGKGDYPTVPGTGGYSSRYALVDYYPSNGESAFKHEAGRNCFTRIIDPARYPLQKPGTPGIMY